MSDPVAWHLRLGGVVTEWNARSVGLGLAISKGIVEAHGGRIWADGRVGEGCAVHFTLPASPRS